MASKREDILLAIKATLTGVSGVPNGRIYRARATPVGRGESPALIVRALRDDARDILVNRKERSLLVAVETYVRAADPEAAADPIVVSAHGKVMADTTLGGKAIDMTEEDTIYETDDADLEALIVTETFRVHYRHTIGSLDA